MANTTRTTQLAVEVVAEGDKIRITQLAVEIVTDPNAGAATAKRRTVTVMMT